MSPATVLEFALGWVLGSVVMHGATYLHRRWHRGRRANPSTHPKG